MSLYYFKNNLTLRKSTAVAMLAAVVFAFLAVPLMADAQALGNDIGVRLRARNLDSGNTIFVNSIASNPGRRVQFEVVVSNFSNTVSQTNVTVAATLPTLLVQTAGDPAIIGAGVVLGTLNPNSTRTIFFEATVGNSPSFTPGNAITLTATVAASSSQSVEDQNQARVVVTTLTPNQTGSGSGGGGQVAGAQAGSAELFVQIQVLNVTNKERTFRNTTNAKPGDRLRFQLRVETQGTATQTDVVGQVDLPSTLKFATGQSRIVGSGQNFGTMTPGESETAAFEATVKTGGPTSFTALVTGQGRSDQSLSVLDTARVEVNDGSQTFSQTGDLIVDHRVRNLTRNETLFQETTNARPQDRLEFQIIVRADGGKNQTNVRLNGNLSSQLTFAGGDASLFGTGLSFGTISAGTQRTVSYETTVAGTAAFPENQVATLINTAIASSNESGQQSDDASVLVQPSGAVLGAILDISKTAFNRTKGVDGTTVAANPGDVIAYTLSRRNSGSATLTNVVIEDDISDVLELARISSMGLATSVDNGVIRFPAVNIPAGSTVTRTFEVSINDAGTFPSGSDLVMSNTFGNETQIRVANGRVAGVSLTPPRTGAGIWLIIMLATLTTLGFWSYIRRKEFSSSIK